MRICIFISGLKGLKGRRCESEVIKTSGCLVGSLVLIIITGTYPY